MYKTVLVRFFAAFCGVAGILLAGCGTAEEVVLPPVDPVVQEQANAYNAQVADSAVTLLHTGDIVVRTGLGADSYILTQMNLKDKTYSHCGIVLVEHGYPFVYHSIGGELNPDERLKRDSARHFFSPEQNLGIGIFRYNYPESRMDTLQKTVRAYYKQRPRFDMKFDLQTDSCLYCAEFIYKAVNKAMADTGYISTSFALGHRFVGIDNLFLNPHASTIWQVRYK